MTRPEDAALLDSWQLSLHDKSPRTVQLYRQVLELFCTWLVDTDRPPLFDVTRRDCEAWFTEQREAGRAKATMRSRWIALRSFYGWALEEEEVDANPMERVKVSKPDADPPDVLTDDQLRALLKETEGRDFNERRDHAMIRTMAATGLRASELVGLRLDDVDLTSRIIAVHHAKGDRMRYVRIDPTTAAAIDRYKRVRARHRFADRPQLWIGHRGPMTRKGLGPMLQKRAEEAGIGHVHPHQLRHTWAAPVPASWRPGGRPAAPRRVGEHRRHAPIRVVDGRRPCPRRLRRDRTHGGAVSAVLTVRCHQCGASLIECTELEPRLWRLVGPFVHSDDGELRDPQSIRCQRLHDASWAFGDLHRALWERRRKFVTSPTSRPSARLTQVGDCIEGTITEMSQISTLEITVRVERAPSTTHR